MRLGLTKVTAAITLDDGSVVTVAEDDRPFDRTVFERRFSRTWPPVEEIEVPQGAEDAAEDQVVVDLNDELWLFMAWVQINRTDLASGKTTPAAFDPWYATVVDSEWHFEPPAKKTDSEDDVVPPTVPAPSSGA